MRTWNEYRRNLNEGTTMFANDWVKKFYQTDGVGKAKYTISTHDGVKTNKDGSVFYDIATFKSKKELNAYITKLIKDGYVLVR